jgi:integrase/recombinase XerD
MGRSMKPPGYTHGFIDRHGKPRFYLRRPGLKRVPLPGLPWSPEFMAAYEAAMAGQGAPIVVGAARTKPGTVKAVVISYYAHRRWLENLSPASRKMRRPILERFREEHGDKRVALLRAHHITKILSSKKPFAQRNWFKTLRGLMAFCLEEHHLRQDPTEGVRLAKPGKTLGHMTWGDEQVAQYRYRHPVGTTARLALELLLNVAARRGDAYRLGRQHVRNGCLSWRPSKTMRSTAKMLTIRIMPELQAAFEAIPASDSLTFLTTDSGKAFASAAAFGNKFADWCRESGLPVVACEDGRKRSYRAHGLRKAACRKLAYAGCTAPEIMAISGHSTLSQVQVYIDEVEQERMAEAAMTKREIAGHKTATSSGKPGDPVCQTAS